MKSPGVVNPLAFALFRERGQAWRDRERWQGGGGGGGVVGGGGAGRKREEGERGGGETGRGWADLAGVMQEGYRLSSTVSGTVKTRWAILCFFVLAFVGFF